MQKEKLVDVLKKVGKTTELFESPDGSQVLLLPYGGRILGLFGPRGGENFFWTHTALESPETAQAFYAGDQWHNSGGDRTWLAPEIDFFFPDFPDLVAYYQPRQLDPGQYQIVKNDKRVQMVNQFSVTPARSRQKVELKITKGIGPAANPLRYERGLQYAQDLEYAGYTLYSSMEMLSGSESSQIGLWNLLQMPHGGDLLIPTYSKSQPKIYFGTKGTIGPDDLLVDDHLICYRMRQEGEHKLGIRAAATAGRAGYLYQEGSHWALIIRNFAVNPSGEYIDVPREDHQDLGYLAQACNVNSGLGSFSELEYHEPAIGKGTGMSRYDGSAQTWAYRGSQPAVLEAARLLVSPSIR